MDDVVANKEAPTGNICEYNFYIFVLLIVPIFFSSSSVPIFLHSSHRSIPIHPQQQQIAAHRSILLPLLQMVAPPISPKRDFPPRALCNFNSPYISPYIIQHCRQCPKFCAHRFTFQLSIHFLIQKSSSRQTSWSFNCNLQYNPKKKKMTNCRPNSIINWLIPFTLLLLFIYSVHSQQPQQHEPSIWLIQPPARLLENGPSNQRLPERTCPTPSTNQDPLTEVPAGIPFRVQWHDSDQLPVDLAKLELFSSDAGHLLARLEVEGGEGGPNGSVLAMATIPTGLRCASCVLRLSVELDERIQLLSCSQVRVEPARRLLDEPEQAECATDADCNGGGQCLSGQCFCQAGFYGERCLNVNSAPIVPSPSNAIQSVRFPTSGSQFNWLASPQENVLRIGLTIPQSSTSSSPRWFILGLQSTEGDPKCQLAMMQWKQRLENGNEDGGEEARARAGVLIRVEQNKGENVLAGGDLKATDQGEGEKRPSKLNIHKLANNGTTAASEECGPNQQWEKCPELGRECEPSCDWTAQPESIPSCPPRTEQCGKPRCVCAEGYVRLSNSKDECKPFGFCQAPEVTATNDASTAVPAPSSSSGGQSCPRNETWEKCGRACEPSCSSMYSEELCGSGCEAAGCTCADNFVRSAEGKCIQWTECPNLKERIGSINSTGIRSESPSTATINEKTTTQKSTNEDDLGTLMREGKIDKQQNCAGNETFNECGRICETDCQSIFERAECHECGQPACSCRQGFARLNGQCIYWGDCQFVPESTTTTQSAGHKHIGQAGPSKEGGTSTLSATTIGGSATKSSTTKTTEEHEPPMDLCHGQWQWPNGCTGQKCLYSIQWAFDAKTDSVEFTLETRPAVSRKMPQGSPIWSGVGFSPSGTLLDADMIVVEADQQQNAGKESVILSIMDMHVDEQLEQLRLDKHQNVQLRQAQFANGLLKAKFSRKRRTGDAAGQDMEFGDEGNCFRFLFPVSGGRFEQSGNISVPVADSLYASDSEICIRPCTIEGNKGGEKITKPASREEDEATSCEREFRWPEGCKDEQCEYRANWAWEKAGDNVQFNISSRGIGRWTGIGFSRDGRMAGSDIVTGWVYDQKAYLTDRFAHAQQQPAIDPLDRQDIFDVGGSLIDEIQTISFRRRVLSPDRTTDLALAPQCMHFLFPVQGGRVLARSSRDFQQARTPIGFHDQQQPISSTKRICLCDRPKDFQAADQRKMGRAKRATDVDGGSDATGGPYQCADIAIFQVIDGIGGAIRVVDAFGLSNDSLRRDEMWGGRQSIGGVELSITNDSKATIWIRKTLKESGNEGNADLSVQHGQIPVFLASGQGPRPEMNRAERLEFAMVDLMAGASEIERKSSSTNLTTTSIGTTSTVKSSTTDGPTTIIEVMSTTTAAIPLQKVETTTEEDVNGQTKHQPSIDSQPPSPMPAPAFQPPFPPDQSSPSEEPNGNRDASLMMDENCFGGFAFPEGCMQPSANVGQCQYTLEWLVQPEAAKVHFQLNARMPADHWTGIGFSSDGAMVNADALVVLLLPDGQVSVQDQFSPGYGRPNIDLHQNVEMVSTRSADGLWSVNFSRPLFTEDRQQDADLRECQHFLFLHSANPLMPGTGELRKHAETPVISENPICLGKCGQHKNGFDVISTVPGGDEDKDYTKDYEDSTTTNPSTTTMAPITSTTTSAPQQTDEEATTTKVETPSTTTATKPFLTTTKVAQSNEGEKINLAEFGGGKPKQILDEDEQQRTFNVAIRLPNERWDPKLEDPESTEFTEMAQKLSYSLQALIAARWPSLADIRVQKFAEGSVLALLQIRFNGTAEMAAGSKNMALPDAKQLKEFLQESAAQGMAAELILDKEMLEVQEQRPPDEEEEDRWGPLRELQGWLLAFFGLLLLICIIGGLLFCAFRSRRRRHQHRTYPTKQQQHQQMFYNGQMMNTAQMFGGNNGASSGYQQGQYAPFPCEKDRESDTTTAKTSTSNGGQQQNGATRVTTARRTETPRGIGEATYREWFSKVASKDAPSHYQDWQMPPPTPLPRGVGHPPPPIASPYLSYPNDPAFYTLNGEHRIVPPPPAYYRPF